MLLQCYQRAFSALASVDSCGIIIIQFDVRCGILKMPQWLRWVAFLCFISIAHHLHDHDEKEDKCAAFKCVVREWSKDVKSKHTRKIICLLVNKYWNNCTALSSGLFVYLSSFINYVVSHYRVATNEPAHIDKKESSYNRKIFSFLDDGSERKFL